MTVLHFGKNVSRVSTDPPTENKGRAVVAALENATNVSILYCAVTNRGGSTIPRLTLWFLTETGGVTREPIFTVYRVYPTSLLLHGAYQEKLTIPSFGRNLNMGINFGVH